ncbi:FAD-dependent oxidoreductase [Rhodovulum sp.]|uniref:FAD-dependent oxidoreductase n=1 Tax=Rhodovulum sp. TaxID=34009 RepID=UPI0032E40034
MESSITLAEARAGRWDVLVIGAGMGGGLLGRRLAERGLSVLFLEKGPAGHSAEQTRTSETIIHPAARLLRGLWPKPAEARLDGVVTRFFGPYGAGPGGSSVFYAAALERPERHDLDDDPALPYPTGGWPVGFDAFRPYFDEAAALLHLSGTPDPLSAEPPPLLQPPGPLSAGDAALIAEMEARGLHPYRLHLAVRDPGRCRGCLGAKCLWDCKMDGRSAGVRPALATGRAALLAGCDVREILEDGRRVTGLRVHRNRQEAELAAPVCVLCAGALGSARLLLASNRHDPAGCANSSGWVGRGLMFHLNEIFVLWPRGRQDGEAGFGKAISLRDLYALDGQRFGLIQSMGMEVSHANMVAHLNRLYDQSVLRRWR